MGCFKFFHNWQYTVFVGKEYRWCSRCCELEIGNNLFVGTIWKNITRKEKKLTAEWWNWFTQRT